MSIFRRGRGIVESRQPTRNIQSKNWHPFEKEQDRVTYMFGSDRGCPYREGGGLQLLELMASAVCVFWLPVKLALLTSSLSRLRAVDQLSPHSAVGRPGLRSDATPGRLSQGRTQRVTDGRPIWPQCSHTVSAKHSSAMGAGACSRENNLSASQLR